MVPFDQQDHHVALTNKKKHLKHTILLTVWSLEMYLFI